MTTMVLHQSCDTVALVFTFNQLFCHCGFICFDLHWQLASLLRNGRQYCFCLKAEWYETIINSKMHDLRNVGESFSVDHWMAFGKNSAAANVMSKGGKSGRCSYRVLQSYFPNWNSLIRKYLLHTVAKTTRQTNLRLERSFLSLTLRLSGKIIVKCTIADNAIWY